jgi:hypothetical protein
VYPAITLRRLFKKYSTSNQDTGQYIYSLSYRKEIDTAIEQDTYKNTQVHQPPFNKIAEGRDR